MSQPRINASVTGVPQRTYDIPVRIVSGEPMVVSSCKNMHTFLRAGTVYDGRITTIGDGIPLLMIQILRRIGGLEFGLPLTQWRRWNRTGAEELVVVEISGLPE